MLEKDLFPPLEEYLKKLGFKVYCEVANFNRAIDVVAERDLEQWALELKTKFNQKLYSQCCDNNGFFNKTYAVSSGQCSQLFLDACKLRGIGIIQIDGESAYEYLEAKFIDNVYNGKKDLSKLEEGGEAGVPNQKGCGVTYDVLEKVKAYLQKNPKATWKEIYENIECHYSSQMSLANSMREWRGFDLLEYKKTIN